MAVCGRGLPTQRSFSPTGAKLLFCWIYASRRVRSCQSTAHIQLKSRFVTYGCCCLASNDTLRLSLLSRQRRHKASHFQHNLTPASLWNSSHNNYSKFLWIVRFLSTKADTTRYDTIVEFNVDSIAECIQLNLAHVGRKNIKKKKLKQTNASAHLVQYRLRSVKVVRKAAASRRCRFDVGRISVHWFLLLSSSCEFRIGTPDGTSPPCRCYSHLHRVRLIQLTNIISFLTKSFYSSQNACSWHVIVNINNMWFNNTLIQLHWAFTDCQFEKVVLWKRELDSVGNDVWINCSGQVWISNHSTFLQILHMCLSHFECLLVPVSHPVVVYATCQLF